MRLVVAISSMLVLVAASASARMLYAVRDAGGVLIRIDSDTLTAQDVGPTGFPAGEFGDLAYVDRTHTMYWIAGRGDNSLYTINTTTGEATLVGSHGRNDLFALGYDESSDTLYAQSTFGFVYEISMTDATPTLIGSNAVYPGGYDYNPTTDQLVVLESGAGGFWEIDRSDGSATQIHGGDPINDCDVAWDGDRGVYWAIDYDGNLYRYDASWTRTVELTGLGGSSALESLPYLFADGFESGDTSRWTVPAP